MNRVVKQPPARRSGINKRATLYRIDMYGHRVRATWFERIAHRLGFFS